MSWAGRIGVLIALALIASMSSVTAYAQTLYLTTNKTVYNEDERIVAAGKVFDVNDRRPVQVKIISDGEECAKQNVRPLRDGSFVSRPILIDGCGLGEFSISATHAGMTASNFFAVEGRTKVSDNFELRAIRTNVSDVQDIVNARIREVLDANLAIPERAADAYGKGATEISLTLQAIERGNVEAAMEHRDSAHAHFQEALDLLSPEKLSTAANEILEERTRISAMSEWFGRLQDLFRRLIDLADKNGIVADQEFEKISEILMNARQSINERMADSAEESLLTADRLLEETRQKLIQRAEGDDSQVLSLATNRLEILANELRQQAEGVPRALAQVNASFVHLNGAKSSIEDSNYESAKTSLDLALKKLEGAKRIIENRV